MKCLLLIHYFISSLNSQSADTSDFGPSGLELNPETRPWACINIVSERQELMFSFQLQSFRVPS